MGFEQLAALKAQLAAQAKAEKAEKAAKAAEVPKRATPPRARDAAPAKPVDPVVHTIARLQRRFPLAFPKHPAPKVPLKIGIFEDLTSATPNFDAAADHKRQDGSLAKD